MHTKKKIFTRFFKKDAGFSIIESLFGVFFFLVALVPVMSITALSFDITGRIKNNLIATNLAQEGIEVTRALRDSNWLIPNRSFSEGLLGTWQIEWNTDWAGSQPQIVVSAESSPLLKIDSSGVYNYISGIDTKFRRAVTVTEVNAGLELLVVSTVVWPVHKGPTPSGCPSGFECLRIESHMFNWK